MRYQEFEPSPELAPWIKLFWVFESRSNESVPETIVADGCPELIVHFGVPFKEAGSTGELLKQPVAVACGQLTKPLVLHSSLEAGMIGIRFQPSGMAPFVNAPMKMLTDARVPAEALFAGMDRLLDDIMDSTNDLQRIGACNRFLMSSLRRDRISPSIRNAIKQIKQTNGQITVETLSDLVGTSRRSLELSFQKEVGTTPKMFCRITRFRCLYDAVSEDEVHPDWLSVAMDSGFFDQSHLIRDFRRFTGGTPTSFLAEQSTFAHSVNHYS